MGLEESTTYQYLLHTGALRHAQKNLLRQGRERFGNLPTKVKTAIQAIDDVDRLDELSLRLLRADSWDELLELSPPRPRRRRQKD